MKVLVTGARGFVGRRVVEALGRRAGVEVVAPSRTELNLLSDEAVAERIAREAPDVVIHLAGESNPWTSGRVAIFDVNTMGTLRLLDAMEKLPEAPRRRSFVFASAGYVYGPSTPTVVEESRPLQPFGDYALSKFCAEQILAASRAGVRCVSARLFNVIGVGHDPKYVVPKIAAAFVRGDDRLEIGNTTAVRDFVDVRDVAEALVRLGLDATCDGPVNVCTGIGTSLSGIIDLMKEISGRDMQIVTQAQFARPGDNMYLVGSDARLRDAGFARRHDLRDTLAWMLGTSEA